MPSPNTTLPNDEKQAQDDGRNPGDLAYREGMGAGYAGAGADQAESFANDPVNSSSKVKEDEEKGSAAPKGDWDTDVKGGGEIDKTRLQKALTFTKKRGAIFGIVGILGIGGGFAATFLGPAGMLVSVMESFISSNDTSSTSMERRFLNVFGNATNGDGGVLCTSSKVTCKMGRISNKALAKLSSKGVTALDGTSEIDFSKRGYPSKNPTNFIIDLGDGSRPTVVPASEMPAFLADKKNAKFANKILGTGGAFNLRVKAWSGKFISKSLYKKFGISRAGGLADGTNKNSRYSDVLDKLRKKIPGLDKLNNIKTNVNTKVTKHLGSAKKGGTGYLLAVSGCIAVKAPGYIAAGVAAVQLAQTIPIVMDTVLSPGSKLKGSGVDPASAFDGADMSAIGALVTNQTPRESDGKMTSALDSPYLQAAMGINTGKPPVSPNYTPGFSVLTSEFVRGSIAADRATAQSCNAIMSPAAMYTAMAVDAGITVAASATVVGGFIKIIASLAIGEIATAVVAEVASDKAVEIVTGLASNDLLPKAEGEALGDVIGISATSFFAAGGMARSLPVLQTGEQLAEFAALQQDSENFQRDMDIASLSPFDTSSRYTFMGSIVHNLHMTAFATGGYKNSVLSMLSNAVIGPLGLSTRVGASAGFTESSCGYAADFGLESNPTSKQKSPAINVAGLPCTGLTKEQSSMPVSTAISLIEAEGWFDESKSFNDNADIYDLVSSGYIKDETPLSDYIENCSDASTGDYLFNSAGCTIDSNVKSPNVVTEKINSEPGVCSADEGCITDREDVDSEVPAGLSNGNAMTAIPVFLLDFQSVQSLNGEDDEVGGGGGGGLTDKKAIAQKIIDKNKITYLGEVVPKIEDIASGAVDADAEPCGININILKMIDAMTDVHSIKISSLNRQCNDDRISNVKGRHYAGNGSGIDIAVVDGVAIRGRDPLSISIINLSMPILIEAGASTGDLGSRIGQSNCPGPAAVLGERVTEIGVPDFCNHVHFDVNPASDPTLKFSPGW